MLVAGPGETHSIRGALSVTNSEAAGAVYANFSEWSDSGESGPCIGCVSIGIRSSGEAEFPFHHYFSSAACGQPSCQVIVEI
jgi:hypothetical protein